MKELIQLNTYPIRNVLDILLQDKTTKKNIIWATHSYEMYGNDYKDTKEITKGALIGLNPVLIQPRILKSLEEQQERTKKKAEVFTPAWICNLMNNHCDEEWFGKKDVFNAVDETTWKSSEEKIAFLEGKTWKDYINSRRLEITCGEAPYLVSRYDASTGEIIDVPNRIGILDRKLRVVNENTNDIDEWLKWAQKAFQSVYGYEYQGDNLLIGRINMLMTFVEYYEYRWHETASQKLLNKIANIISWNLWQMDGLSGTVPLGVPQEKYEQISLFDFEDELNINEEQKKTPICRIYDWRSNKSISYESLKR